MNDESRPALSDPGPEERAPPPTPQEGPRYQRQGLLGQGGMGKVFAAHDPVLGRSVALKVAATPALAARLAREAGITAQLEHPGIVAVYDAGVHEGQAWYAMRLIRGRTLHDRLRACPDLDARLALLPHLHAACQAVAYAHAMGFVHRDLKPANIMVGEFGETQVADWGLATPLDEARGAPPGAPAGTPGFISPEQDQGAPATRASDVYGLGVALALLLTGGDRVPPARPAEVPPELWAIVARCLRTEPAARYPDAGALADDLGRWLGGQRVRAHDYQPVELLERLFRAWRVPIAVGAVSLALLVLIGGFALHRTRAERAAAEAHLGAALTTQALAALDDERLPEAGVLAARALQLAPSPEARGVLVATQRANATLLGTQALPPICRHAAVIDPTGTRMACAGEGRVELWGLGPLRQESTLALDAAVEPVWVGARLLVSTPTELLRIEGGQSHLAMPDSGWMPYAAGEVAFAARGREAIWLGADGLPTAFPICAAYRLATAVLGEELVVGCDDGRVRAYDQAGQSREILTLGQRPTWSGLGRVGPELLIGHLNGDVEALNLQSGLRSPTLKGLGRLVLAVQAVPERDAVVVLDERGVARIWHRAAGSWAGSLPGGARRLAAGPGPGEVYLVGDTLSTWRVTEALAPSVLSFGSGVSQVAPSPDGRALAVALGTGEVAVRRREDGRELWRWSWTAEVAKAVAWSGDDRLAGAAMGAPIQLLGPDASITPVASGQVVRRLGRLADGRVWGLGYGSTALVVAPDGTVDEIQVGPGPFDGSSSPDGGTAVIVDARGGLWFWEHGAWVERGLDADAVAVDVGDGGHPLAVAHRREVCVDQRCVPMTEEPTEIALFGDQLAVGTRSGEILLLSASTGEVRAVLRGHVARVSSLEFGPAGDWLVSGSWDGTARIWALDGLDEPADRALARRQATWGLDPDVAMRGPQRPVAVGAGLATNPSSVSAPVVP